MDAERVPPEPAQPILRLVDWFALNPRVGLVGTMASVIGLPLCLVLFLLAQKERDIRYTTSASPTTIVKNGQSSNLRVYYQDKELTSDVTSIQIAIWNAGRESVKRENILSKTLALKLNPPSRILEARVKKVTRNIVNFQLDTSESAAGILNCSWDILEPGDGALLEVFQAGTFAGIVSEGAIEGQVPVRRVILGEQPLFLYRWQIAVLSIIAVLIALGVARKRYRATKQMGETIVLGLATGGSAWLILALVMGISQMFTWHAAPFAF